MLKLDNGPQINFCRPAADPMIEGLSEIYGRDLLLLVLTGMGSDGLNGAIKLHDNGGTIVAQDRETSVVWGMPRAVTEKDICKAVLPLEQIASYTRQAFREERA